MLSGKVCRPPGKSPAAYEEASSGASEEIEGEESEEGESEGGESEGSEGEEASEAREESEYDEPVAGKRRRAGLASSRAAKRRDLVAEVERLRKTTLELQDELQRERQRAEAAEAALEGGEASPPLLEEPAPAEERVVQPPVAPQLADEGAFPFQLALVMPSDTNTAPVGTTWKGSGFRFPHRVATHPRTGARELVIESRPFVTIMVKLQRKDGQPASEYDLDPAGGPAFRLDVLYADSQREVLPEDLSGIGRSSSRHLLDPPESQIREKCMGGDEVVWNFKCLFKSRQTRNPSGQAFRFRVSPTSPALARYRSLTVHTLPFRVISRQFKPGSRVG